MIRPPTVWFTLIIRGVELRQGKLPKKLTGLDQRGDAPLVSEAFTSHRREIRKLAAHPFTQILMVCQFPLDEVAISKLAPESHAVDQHHPTEALIEFRVLDKAHEWRQSRS
jgi:hypothetical protein